jgi:chromate reductase
MEILAISGSLRAASTNAALLRAFACAAPEGATVTFDPGAIDLPAYSPDLDADLPAKVRLWAEAVGRADALIVSVPEYVHALPGAFKNALDWLVPRPELAGKRIGILHASHRGEDVLADLRRVLATVSTGFDPALFAQFAVMKQTPEEIAARFDQGPDRTAMDAFWLALLSGRAE